MPKFNQSANSHGVPTERGNFLFFFYPRDVPTGHGKFGFMEN